MLPTYALAEEIPDTGLCEHHSQHTADCGYTEGEEGTPCSYVCEVCDPPSQPNDSETDGSTTQNKEKQDSDMTFETDDSSDVEDSTASIQEMLDSLPTADELRDMTFEEQQAVYDRLQTTYDAYIALTTEEQAKISGAEKFDELFAVFKEIADATATNVNYLDANGVEQTCERATVMEDNTAWDNGWYVVTSDISISGRVVTTGDVHLILTDGTTLTADSGISVTPGNSLTIYGQSAGTGKLKADTKSAGCSAAIGGGDFQAAGTITINGGIVIASGAMIAGEPAAIGGGGASDGGTITINGGDVTASGAYTGIGCGGRNTGGLITITGGTVTAKNIGIKTTNIYYTYTMNTLVTGGVVRLIEDSKISLRYGNTSDNTKNWNALIYKGVRGDDYSELVVYGTQTLDGPLLEKAKVTVDSNATLTLGCIVGEDQLNIENGGTVIPYAGDVKPAAPAQETKGVHFVRLAEATDSYAYLTQFGYTVGDEKSVPEERWQKSTQFPDLEPNTTYTFYARYKGYKYTAVSAQGTPITTDTDYPSYTISSCEDLQGLNDWLAAKDPLAFVRVYLTADLDMAGVNFSPISTTFRGVFDGQGHTISNLTINGGTEIGMFQCVDGTIKNLGLIDASVAADTGHIYTGSLCGKLTSDGIIENCYALRPNVEGSSPGQVFVGGIVGQCYGIMRNCYVANANLYAYSSRGKTTASGGIVAYIGNGSNDRPYCKAIENCYTDYSSLIWWNHGTEHYKKYLELVTDCEDHVDISHFASGEMTLKLNRSRTDNAVPWRQTLGENGDAWPVLDVSHGIVYTYTCADISDYTNDANIKTQKSHTYDKDSSEPDVCTNCGYRRSQSIMQQPTSEKPTFGVTRPTEASYQWQKVVEGKLGFSGEITSSDGWTQQEDNVWSTSTDNGKMYINYAVPEDGEIAFSWKGDLDYYNYGVYRLSGTSEDNDYYESDYIEENKEDWTTVTFSDLPEGTYELLIRLSTDDRAPTFSVDLTHKLPNTWLDIPVTSGSTLTCEAATDSLVGEEVHCVATYPWGEVLTSDSFKFKAVEHTLKKHDAIAATCTEAGSVLYWSCSVCKRNFSDEKGTEELSTTVIEALGHEWLENPDVNWSDDYSTATATFTCSRDSSHEQEVSSIVTSATSSPTCTEKGKTVYSAEFLFDGKKYSSVKDVELKPLGHDWKYVQGSGDSSNTITASCKNDSTHTASAKIFSDAASYVYTGSDIKKAELDLSNWTASGLAALSADDITYSGDMKNVTEAGVTARITVGTGDNTATASTTYKIALATMPDAVIKTYSGVYDGATHDAVKIVSGALDGSTVYYSTDYDAADADAATWKRTLQVIDAGTTTVHVKITNKNYSDWISAAQTVTIEQKELTPEMVSDIAAQYYTGNEVTPAVTAAWTPTGGQELTLVASKDYKVSYANHIEVSDGTGTDAPTATITGKGNYKGSIDKTFAISYHKAPAYKVNGEMGDDGWYTTDVTFSANGWQISTDKSSWAESYIHSAEGENNLTLYFKQNDTDYLTDKVSETVKIDKAAPTIAIAQSDTANYKTSDAVKLTVAAGSSGVSAVEVSTDGKNFSTKGIENTDDGYTFTVTANATYTFRVTNGAGVTAITGTDGQEAKLTYTKIDGTTPKVSIDSGSYRDGDWTNKDVLLTATNKAENLGTSTVYYKVDDGEWQASNAPIAITQDTSKDGVTYTFKMKAANGLESEEQSITVKRDTTAPEGDVSIQNSSVKKAINEISFNLFYRETVNVNISGSDHLSGVASVQYYRSSKILTEDQITALTKGQWQDYSSAIDDTAVDAEKFIYYVKITDKAGNMTFFGSDGATFDTVKPTISGIADDTGYYTTQKVNVTDTNLTEVTLDGETIPLTADGSAELSLEGDREATYEIVATDKAGNKTEYTVTMQPIDTISEPIAELTIENVKSTNKDTITSVKETAETTEAEEATDGEKAKLKAIIDRCDELLARIAEASEAANSESIKKVTDVTPENVKPENKTDLEQAKEDLEKALEDYSDNYTEDEKQGIKDQIEQIEKALEVIKHAEDAQSAIDKLPTAGSVKKSDANAIKSAREIYEKLTDYEKSLVDVSKLEAAEKALDKLNNTEVSSTKKNNSSTGTSINKAATSTKTSTRTPAKTGDDSQFGLWYALLLASGSAAVIAAYNRKKKTKAE